MHIRLATAADWGALEALNKIIDYHQPEAFMHEHIKLERVLVVELEDQVIGYALWQVIWGNTPLLALVKVFPKYQKKGAGSALITEFEARIKRDGFKNYMSSTMTNNELGQSFHVKKGFAPIGTLHMHYGDEIFYRKDL